MKSLRKALSNYRCVPLVFIFCCAWSLILWPTGVSDTKASEVVERREPPAGPEKETYYVQVGAFVAASPIEACRRKLEQSGFKNVKQAKVFHRGRWLTRVMVGPYETRQEARRVMAELKGLGMEAFIRRERSHAKSAPVLREPEEKKHLVAVSEPKPVPIKHFQLVQPQGPQESTQAMEVDDKEALPSHSPKVLEHERGQVSGAATVSTTEVRESMKSFPKPEPAPREDQQIALRNRSTVSLQEGVVAAAESTQAESEKAGESDVVGSPEQKEARQTKVTEGSVPVLLETRSILIPRGSMVVEPSFNYSHFDRNVITISGFSIFEALVIGRIQVEEIDRDILTGQLSLRYGITDRVQAELEIPYLYRRDRLVIPAGTANAERAETISDQGLGDIEGGLVFHVYRGRGWKPDLLVNVRGKSRTGRDPFDLDTKTVDGREVPDELPTGSGFYGVSSGFNLVKASDPAVFFAGANYYWNFKRDVTGGVGEVDPGNSIEYFLGMALAVSEKVSLNFSFQNIFNQETQQNDVRIPETEVNSAVFFAGLSYRISPKVGLLGSVGFGVSEDAPDFQVQLNLPIYISLF